MVEQVIYFGIFKWIFCNMFWHSTKSIRWTLLVSMYSLNVSKMYVFTLTVLKEHVVWFLAGKFCSQLTCMKSFYTLSFHTKSYYFSDTMICIVGLLLLYVHCRIRLAAVLEVRSSFGLFFIPCIAFAVWRVLWVNVYIKLSFR